MLVIIDNASSDDSADVDIPTGIAVEVIHNAANLGFAAACNQGAARGGEDVILFVNPHTRLLPGSLTVPLEHLHSDNSLGIAGIRLTDAQGRAQPTCGRFPGPRDLLAQATGITRAWPQTDYMMRTWAHDQTRKVDHLSSSFFMIRRDLFERLGGFDERFFVYLEDLDMSKRVGELGFGCLFVGSATAFHPGPPIEIEANHLYHALRSRLQFAHKHFRWPAVLAVAAATLLIEPLVRVLEALFSGSGHGINETARAYRSLYLWLVT